MSRSLNLTLSSETTIEDRGFGGDRAGEAGARPRRGRVSSSTPLFARRSVGWPEAPFACIIGGQLNSNRQARATHERRKTQLSMI